MDKVMEKLDSRGMKFVLAALKEHLLWVSLFFCLFTLFSASVSALRIVFINISYESTEKWETCQISKEDRFLVRV
jgi:hypothetical protein